MTPWSHVDLFSGIGGFSLAAHWAGFETIAHCEINPFCRQVLTKNFPAVPLCEDVNEFADWFVARFGNRLVHVVTGGFPCQDISSAGRGAGLGNEDAPTGRSGLWFAMLAVVRRLRPAYVVAENVPALRTRGVDTVLGGLEEAGYTCGAFVVGADDLGAPHRRKRVFVVAERSDLSRMADGDRLRELQPARLIGDRAKRSAHDCAEGSTPLASANGVRRGTEHKDRRGWLASAGLASLDGQGDTFGVVLADTERVAFGSAQLRNERHGGLSRRAQAAGFNSHDGGAAGDALGMGVACRSGREGQHGRGTGSKLTNGHSEPQNGRHTQSGMGGATDGVSRGLDGITRNWPARPGQAQWEWEAPRTIERGTCPHRADRLKALGNAVVPAQALLPLLAVARRLNEGILK